MECDPDKIQKYYENNELLVRNAFFFYDTGLNNGNDENLKRLLFDMIDHYNNNKNKMYGPFNVISQASGFGKKTQMKFLSNYIHVVYCNLRLTQCPINAYENNILTDKELIIKFSHFFKYFINLIKKSELKKGKFFNNEQMADKLDSSFEIEHKSIKIKEYLREIENENVDSPILFVFDDC